MWLKNKQFQKLGGGWLERFGLSLWSKLQMNALHARKDPEVVKLLTAVQKEERREKLRESVMKKLDDNPEMKEAYRTLVKNLPEAEQEKAMVSLALRTSRTVAPPSPKQAQGAKV